MAKFQEKIEAKNLRKSGLSIKKIAKKLKVSVSSVSYWVRDIILTKEQLEVLGKHARDPYYGNRLKYINEVKRNTNIKIEKLKNEGIHEVGDLSKRELFLVGSALYWGEGFKKDSQVGFANSDSTMINLFLRWLYECFDYKTHDLIPRLTLNFSHKDRVKEVEEFWSKETKIPRDYFRKPFFQNFKWKKVYENPNDYHGVLRIKVRKSKDFLRKIHGYIEGLRLQSQIG
jgi:transcriptional regulator with XRE-family HTH domain